MKNEEWGVLEWIRALLLVLTVALLGFAGLAHCEEPEIVTLEALEKGLALQTERLNSTREARAVWEQNIYIGGFKAGQTARDAELIEAGLLKQKKLDEWKEKKP